MISISIGNPPTERVIEWIEWLDQWSLIDAHWTLIKGSLIQLLIHQSAEVQKYQIWRKYHWSWNLNVIRFLKSKILLNLWQMNSKKFLTKNLIFVPKRNWKQIALGIFILFWHNATHLSKIFKYIINTQKRWMKKLLGHIIYFRQKNVVS